MILQGLNPQQRAAVEYLDSAVFLSAGAGSGKTKVLTHKIAYLVHEKGIRANRILAITFTKKAAHEMVDRVERMLGIRPRWISTFHSFSVKVLREDADLLGMSFDRRFVIYDTADSLKVVKEILKRLNMDVKEAGAAQEVISKAKQEYRSSIFDYIEALPYPASSYAEVAREYQKDLESSNAMDYDDLLYFSVELLATSPETRMKWSERFDYVMIDEFQDTNDIQFSLIQLLAGQRRTLFAVGDFFQCIYTWRGSRPSNIERFIREFGAKEMRLEKNYRSTRRILDIANTIVNNVESGWSHKVLQLHTDRQEEGDIEYKNHPDAISESIWIAEKIRKLSLSHAYSDMAILIRMTFLSRAFESIFMQYGIPYTIIRGLAFYDRAEIKDLLSYLRFIANPKDRASFERIINTPARGIGKKALSKIRENFRTDWLTALRETKLPAKQRLAADLFLKTLEGHIGLVEERPYTVLMALIEDFGFFTYIEKEYKDESAERMENISELSNVLHALEEEGKPFSEFMEDNLLSSEQDKIGNEDSVKILTLHAAKGLEWPVVFLPALEEEIFPSAKSFLSDASLEEERRLFYVGTTRAKERLYLSSVESRMKFGEISFMTRSRYLDEIRHHL
ncbi:MAG TPA: UvrD-helicase domain-containing protein [Thermodesulfovibrionales bacterium]|nr:UvrD-helicase domain-containing protein [Thermodesulfovibrionales bacterium]